MEHTDNRILRQRKQQETGKIFDVAVESKLARTVKRLDFYPKVNRERIKKQTESGFTLSLLVVGLIVMLFLDETVSYVWGRDAYHDRLSVDSGLAKDVMINLNITFHNIKCNSLHLDAMDAAGALRIDLHTGLYKSPVDKNGRLIFAGQHPHHQTAEREDEEPESGGLFFLNRDYNSAKDPSAPEFCGPCEIYPAANSDADRRREKGEKVKCCNTCASVLKHHEEKGQKVARADVDLCILEESKKHPGCNMAGFVMVEKVKGKIDFAPGGSRRVGFKLLHTFSEQQELEFDITHTVNHLSFGDPADKNLNFMSAQMHPLDGHKYTPKRGLLARMKYNIKAIPVVYSDHATLEEDAEGDENAMVIGGEEKASSFEISVKTHSSMFVPGNPLHTPALTLDYDFYHMQITHIYKREPFARFLLSLCKTLGGLFVVTGIIDQANSDHNTNRAWVATFFLGMFIFMFFFFN